MENKKVDPKETIICFNCGRIISGSYDYIKTKRKTELFFHPFKNCNVEKEGTL